MPNVTITNSGPNPGSSLKAKIKRHHQWLIIAIILTLVIIGAIYYALNPRNSTTNVPPKKYMALTGHNFKAPGSSDSLSFSLPQNFAKTAESSKDKSAALHDSYIDVVKSGSSTHVVGYAEVTATITAYPAPAIPTFIDTILQNKFPGFHIKAAIPEAFNNQNIKSKAWLINFTATSIKVPKAPGLQGQMAYVVGDKIVYYFFLEAPQTEWQANQDVWPQVINSLKISS